MKSWLVCIAPFLLWTSCASQKMCDEPPDIEFGTLESDVKATYLESDRVQYSCIPGYTLEGSEWITCQGQKWSPPPKCLAPCSIRRQELDGKHLLLSGGRSRSQFLQNGQTLEFLCRDGYVLTPPSIRKCVDGHMDLPFCISDGGKNCSHPPTIQNGDIINSFQESYTSGSSVEFKCQRYYAMEGQNRSFCDNGSWTKKPACLEPCTISLADMQRQKIEVTGGIDENESQNIFVPRGHSAELTCESGYALARNPSQAAFVIQCDGKPVVLPECKEVTCNPPSVANGTFRPRRKLYRGGDIIRIECEDGLQAGGAEKIAECTSAGWSPPPKCDAEGKCLPPAPMENGDIMNTPKEEYLPGESVRYQCQNYYRMEGSPMVTCSNGHWSPVPRCLVPCTASEEDMGRNNIQLRWSHDKKLYSESGDTIEFTCIHGFHPARGSPPLRTQCQDGTITYPRCE